MSKFERIAYILIAVGLFVALPAASEVLVMNDGSQLEIDGPWTVKGRQVQFHLPNGTLSSVRLSEVDLAASEAATEEVKRQAELAEAPPEEKKKKERPEPVLVLTNDDIPEASSDGTSASPAQQGRVNITDWSYNPLGGDPAYEVVGTVTNEGTAAINGLRVLVTLDATDEGGTARQLLREASPQQTELDAGDSTDFRLALSRSDLLSSGAADAFGQPSVSFDVQFDAVPGEDGEAEEGQADGEASEDAEDDA